MQFIGSQKVNLTVPELGPVTTQYRSPASGKNYIIEERSLLLGKIFIIRSQRVTTLLLAHKH